MRGLRPARRHDLGGSPGIFVVDPGHDLVAPVPDRFAKVAGAGGWFPWPGKIVEVSCSSHLVGVAAVQDLEHFEGAQHLAGRFGNGMVIRLLSSGLTTSSPSRGRVA
jgi:hypothetical protein